MKSKRLKVYISGPVTGHEDYADKFRAVEDALRELGVDPISPIIDKVPAWFTYRDYIDRGLTLLHDCDALCVINASLHRDRNLKDIPSKGTQLELQYAWTVGMPILEAHPDTRGRYSITIEKCWAGMFEREEEREELKNE